MVGFSNDGAGLGVGGGLTLGANRLTLNANGRDLYGDGLTTFGTTSVNSIADLYGSAVVANGGSVSANRMVIIRQFITSDMASGAWWLTDDYCSLWAENAAQALTSLKQRRLATPVATPTFTTDRGYVFNGTTQYIDTGFVPSLDGFNCTGTDQRIGAYERTHVSSAGVSAGTLDTTTRALSVVNCRNALLATARANCATLNFTLATTDSRGLKTASRANGGLTVQMYNRGVALANGTAAAVEALAPTRSVYIGALNNAGTAASFRASSVGFVVVGGPLSGAQELAQYNAIQAWATSVGANV